MRRRQAVQHLQRSRPATCSSTLSFGFRIIDAARIDKVDVTFPEFVKTLIHGRVGPARAKPNYKRVAYVSTIPEIEEEAEVTPPTPSV